MKAQLNQQKGPTRRMLKFEKESFLCDNGVHDCGVVYLYKGQWFCRPCLQDVVRAAGGNSRSVYSATSFSAEDACRAGQMVCITPKIPRPIVIRPRKRKAVIDPNCEWCGGQGCEECMA